MITGRPMRSIRLPDYCYLAPGAYQVTLWAYQMLPLFGQISEQGMRLGPVGQIAAEEWLRLPDLYPRVHLDLYVIMPNHVHGLFWLVPDVGPGDQLLRQPLPTNGPDEGALRLDAWATNPVNLVVGAFKHNVVERVRRVPILAEHVWQREFYEFVVRTEGELHEFRDHIRENPRAWDADRYYVPGGEEVQRS